MRWSERQRAMLGAMGLRLWLPTASGAEPSGTLAVADDDPVVHAVAAPPVGVEVEVEVEVEARPPMPVAARSAEPGEVASMDWASLRDAVAGCTACRLCESRRQTVFGTGHPAAHWMIVGEAPGEQEDLEGEPFVGKSGQLLDNMLRSIGVGRGAPPTGPDPARQVYIANTLKCRPPGNRNPAPDELARCEAYLVRQIELVRPKVILAMGRFAVQSLLRSSEPVGRLRGRVHRYHGVALIATYHPAYLLRNLEDKARAWDDLCLAVETLQSVPA